MKILVLVLLSMSISGCALLGMSEDQIKERRQNQALVDWERQNERARRYRTEQIPVYLESGTVYMTRKEYDEKIENGRIRRAGDATITVRENGKIVREVEIEHDAY